jgi:UDP-2-acetamido-3-amino-2,3-dideoxy-glucuronate N-acetyltransferase
MCNIAVIGCGYWGKNLVRVFNELGVLKYICDSNTERLNSESLKYPALNTAPSVDIVLQDRLVDSVVLATPAFTHYSLAKQCLLSGRHVFVEKPLALKVEEGAELVALAKEMDKILMVGHVLQYHPAIVKLKELISSGELGKVEYIYSNRLNIGMLRHEENIIWSFAPHDVSTILMLLNEFPKRIRSFGGEYLHKGMGIYDTTLTALDFPSGVKSHIFVSWLHPFKEQRLVVVGNKKMAVFDDLTKEKLFLYSHTIKWNGHIPVAEKAIAETVPVQMSEPLGLECKHFIDCIKTGTKPKTDGAEGLNTLRVLFLAEESLKRDEEIIYEQTV